MITSLLLLEKRPIWGEKHKKLGSCGISWQWRINGLDSSNAHWGSSLYRTCHKKKNQTPKRIIIREHLFYLRGGWAERTLLFLFCLFWQVHLMPCVEEISSWKHWMVSKSRQPANRLSTNTSNPHSVATAGKKVGESNYLQLFPH